MCIFTGEVERVAGTRIFARLESGWQYLAYDMELATAAETAMLLPLPVVTGGGEDALRFISLERYPALFDDLEKAFPMDGGDLTMGRALAPAAAATLKVHSVGAFEASYVPTRRDFSRLDARFQLPEQLWGAMPGYSDYAYAVFKLKAGESRVHPMAFAFQTRETGSLFFPTVHVHARRVEAWARFDHALYAQGPLATNRDWAISAEPLGRKLERDTGGVVFPPGYGYRRLLLGMYENRDTRLALAS